MKLIKQDQPYDCALACLATVLGYRKASDLLPLLGRNLTQPKGLYDGEVIAILSRHGVSSEFWESSEGIEAFEDSALMPTAAELAAKVHHLKHDTFIVGVPSLNGSEGSHYVVVHKGEILDPSNGQMYVGGDSSLPMLVVHRIDKTWMEQNHA